MHPPMCMMALNLRMYHREYGPTDFSSTMQISNPIWPPRKPRGKTKALRLLTKGIRVPEHPWKNKEIQKKKGCCSFIFKRFYLHLILVEVYYATFEHVNKLDLVVHGTVKSGHMLAFSAHISKETKYFVLENLCLGLFIYQVMNKHKSWVKEIMENNGDQSRDLFLCKSDIGNLVGKLAKETYKKDENDAKSFWMWVIKNKEKNFFYQKSSVQVEGRLHGGNMSFTIGIQTKTLGSWVLCWNELQVTNCGLMDL